MRGEVAEIGLVTDEHHRGKISQFAQFLDDRCRFCAARQPEDSAQFDVYFLDKHRRCLMSTAQRTSQDKVRAQIVGLAEAGDALGLHHSFFRKESLVVGRCDRISIGMSQQVELHG